MNTASQSFMPDKDLAYTVLADLKRVTREYAIAATESVCPNVRQMFTQLLNNTLAMQGELYNSMKQQNMYTASSPALRQEIDKQLKEYQQTQQQTNQFVQQRRNQANAVQHPVPPYQQPNQQPQYYM